MFRPLRGYKARYHYLNLLVSCDFDHCNVFVLGPDLVIQGVRQFDEAKAREHALAVAKTYIHEEKREDLPVLETVEWQPLGPGEWLNWRP